MVRKSFAPSRSSNRGRSRGAFRLVAGGPLGAGGCRGGGGEGAATGGASDSSMVGLDGARPAPLRVEEVRPSWSASRMFLKLGRISFIAFSHSTWLLWRSRRGAPLGTRCSRVRSWIGFHSIGSWTTTGNRVSLPSCARCRMRGSSTFLMNLEPTNPRLMRRIASWAWSICSRMVASTGSPASMRPRSSQILIRSEKTSSISRSRE